MIIQQIRAHRVCLCCRSVPFCPMEFAFKHELLQSLMLLCLRLSTAATRHEAQSEYFDTLCQ